MIRKKLFLDFDGVIANTIEGIISLYNEDFAAYPDFQYVLFGLQAVHMNVRSALIKKLGIITVASHSIMKQNKKFSMSFLKIIFLELL